MPKGTYISENLTGEQLRLVNELTALEIEWFRLQELPGLLETVYFNIQELVENLAHKGILKRAERGLYFNVNFNDSNVIGAALLKESAIAYWSALNLHGLTSRFPNTVFVQGMQRKRNKTVFGVNYKFITVQQKKFTGIMEQGYGNYSYRITDIEKTLADCFDLPQYSGGFDGLIAAFAMANLNSQKLIGYCTAINNIAAIKTNGIHYRIASKERNEKFYCLGKKEGKYKI